MDWLHKKDANGVVQKVLHRYSSFTDYLGHVCHGRAQGQNFSYVEVVGARNPTLPLVTCHRISNQQLPIQRQVDSACPTLRRNEVAYLLRMAGEDFLIISASWVGFKKSRKGSEPGHLELQLFSLRTCRGLKPSSSGPANLPGQFLIDLQTLGLEGRVELNLARAAVRAGRHAALGYAMALTLAALHCQLQPRAVTRPGQSRYAEGTVQQGSFAMLIFAGGETVLIDLYTIYNTFILYNI